MKVADITSYYATIREAADMLNVSPQRVHALRHEKPPGFPDVEKLYGDYVMVRSELERFARTYKAKPVGRKKRH